MVEFKSWRDAYLFFRDYCNFSCLNCHYGGARVDENEDNSNMDYATVFCTRHIAMVRLDLQTLCGEWKHKDTGKSLEEFGDTLIYKLTDDELDTLNNRDGKWTIDEIRELCDVKE